jgi:ribosomal protein S18 acetylase RimI-like enzyme
VSRFWLGQITVSPVRPDSRLGAVALRSNFDDIVSRYHGRAATAEEIDGAMHESPSDDLAAPCGLLLVAHQGDAVLGCGGLRLLPSGIGELTRLHVAVKARRRGLASRLLRELGQAARAHRLSSLRLDTRHDLTEARRLYARHGYREVAPFNHGVYAEHWFAKPLGPIERSDVKGRVTPETPAHLSARSRADEA